MLINKNLKVLYCLLLLVCLSAGFSNFMTSIDVPLMYFSVLISVFILLIGNALTDFYVLLALVPFYQSLYTGGGLALGFLLPLFAIGKCVILYKTKKGFDAISILYICIVIMLFLHDLGTTTIGQLVNYLPFMIYPLFALRYIDFNKYNAKFGSLVLISSILIAEYSIFMVQGGSLMDMITSNEIVRFGEGNEDLNEKNQLGGAMGLPIYSVLVITILLQSILGNNIGGFLKIISVILLIFIASITFFTLSKVYLLGLLTLIIIMTIQYKQHFKVKHLFIFLSLCSIAVIVLSQIPDMLLSSIRDRYLIRLGFGSSNMTTAGELTTGRSDLYKQGVEYVLNNPLCLILGDGIYGYRLRSNIGAIHNILFEGILAFGFFGFSIIITLYKQFYNKTRTAYSLSIICYAPLICWVMMNMPASPFIVPKNFILVIFLVLTINKNMFIPDVKI